MSYFSKLHVCQFAQQKSRTAVTVKRFNISECEHLYYVCDSIFFIYIFM